MRRGLVALGALADLLAAIRARPGLREPQPGIFYRKGKAWLHFHEDKAGLFADVSFDGEWQRFPLSQPEQQRELSELLDRGA